MSRIERWTPYGVYFFFFSFFYILFFDHGKIDILRIPFFVFILWQLSRKRIPVRFLFDPVTIGVFVFAAIAAASNALNGLPLDKTIDIINWLFPYLMGKYLVDSESADPEKVILILLTFSAAFAMVGIAGYLFGFDKVFGVTLFQSGRYIFTLRGINKAGFYMAASLLLTSYFIIKTDFSITRKNLMYYLYFLIIAAGLLLTEERKSVFLLGFILPAIVIAYKQYRVVMIIVIAAGILLLLTAGPERFAFDRLLHDTSVQGRYNAWESAVGLFKEKPLFGHGFKSFRPASTRYYNENRETFTFKTFKNYPVAHNLNLNALAETGLFGCIALNSIFFAFRRFYKYRQTNPLAFICGVVALFIYLSMQTGNFVHASTRTDLGFLIFGFYMAMTQKDSTKPETPAVK